jgi:ATP-binding cassette subfamily F protein 3
MGPNGAGKTTLLRIIAGELPYDGGKRSLGHQVAVGYYAQHQLEALDPAKTVLSELGAASPESPQETLRSVLGAFLFTGDDVDKRVAILSGGEKARLALARLLMRPTNLLLLDEPTNHLDLAAREVLEEALGEYGGTLILVSHDRYFINRVASECLEVGRDSLVRYPGDYDAYLRAKASEASLDTPPEPDRSPQIAKSAGEASAEPGSGSGEGGVTGPTRRERRRADAEARQRLSRRLRPLRRRLSAVEEEIAALEQRLTALDGEQARPEVYRDAERARALAGERRECERELATLYEEWSELGDRIAGVEREAASP